MRPNEKRLLLGMLGLVLLGGAVVGSDVYFDKRDLLRGEKSRLENEWIEIEALFEDKEMWELRANWLQNNQPTFKNVDEATQEIYEEALAENVGDVETSNPTLLPTQESEYFAQVGVSLTAMGELPSVLRWIYALNQPESFRVVKNLKLTPDKETEGHVVAAFELLRWYAPAAP